MRPPRSFRWLLVLLAVACGGGGDDGGSDATADGAERADATVDAAGDGGSDAAPADATADGGAPSDATDDTFLGDAMPLGDGACTTPPFASTTSTCTTSTSCITQQGVQCVADASACTNIDGYDTGRLLECGTASDCGGVFCCLNQTISFTPGCPNTASFGADTRATTCAPSDAGCYGIRICRTDADCAGTTHSCTDTVFDFGGTNEPVHFGICW